MVFLSSCSIGSEERQVSGFDGITVGSGLNLIIAQTGSESIRIEAPEKIIPFVTTEVVDGELQIILNPINFINILPIKCYVSVIDLSAIKVSSSATVKCDNLETENLSVEMASSSSGTITVGVSNLDLTVASSASLTVSGKADLQDIKVNSSGSLDAFNLISKNCKIEVQSSGSANINVIENLDAIVNSSATIKYKGSPEINSDVSSSGSLRKVSN